MREKTKSRLKFINKIMKQRIYGQEHAVTAAVALEAARLNGEKRIMLFAGPSGCGKSEIFRQLSRLSSDIFIIDASGLNASGWKGRMKVDDILRRPLITLVTELSRDLDGEDEVTLDDKINHAADRLEKSVIVMDEADKAFLRPGGDYTSHISLAGELLALLEGTETEVEIEVYGKNKSVRIDTTKISFVLLGAFQEIYDKKRRSSKGLIGFEYGDGIEVEVKEEKAEITAQDLIDYGILPELIGRIDRIVTLDGMDEEDYVKFISEECFWGFDITEDDIADIAKKAYRTGLGLRWAKKEIQRREDDAMLREIGIME